MIVSYGRFDRVVVRVAAVLTRPISGRSDPLAWSWEYPGGGLRRRAIAALQRYLGWRASRLWRAGRKRGAR